MITCWVFIDKISPCENLINLETLIMAIFDMSLRLRLLNSFTSCTYIPFLIRWDLVPKFKETEGKIFIFKHYKYKYK